jgi:hypothetical protein
VARITLNDTADARSERVLETILLPHRLRRGVGPRLDRCAFGQRLRGTLSPPPDQPAAPAIDYFSGRAVVGAPGRPTFGLTFVNVDTLEVLVALVPDSLEPAFRRAARNWRSSGPPSCRASAGSCR